MFILAIAWTVLGFIYVGLGFGSWVFWFGFIGYFDFFCGFYGAYKRSHSLLTIFLILTIIAICFYCFYFIFFVIAAVALSACSVYDNCINGNVTTALVIISIQLIASIAIWSLAIYACVLCGRLRRLLYTHIHVHHYDQVSQVQPSYGYQQPQVVYQQPQVVYQQPAYTQQPPPMYTQQPTTTVYRQV